MASPDDGVGRRVGNGETPRIVRSPWTVRVAAWSARHRWLVFVLWFAATFGTLAAGFAAGGINALDVNDDSSGEKVESDVAYDVLGAGEPVAPSERFVVVIDVVDDPVGAASARKQSRRSRSRPRCTSSSRP